MMLHRDMLVAPPPEVVEMARHARAVQHFDVVDGAGTGETDDLTLRYTSDMPDDVWWWVTPYGESVATDEEIEAWLADSRWLDFVGQGSVRCRYGYRRGAGLDTSD